MKRNTKGQLIEILDSIHEMLEIIIRLSRPGEAISDCVAAIEAISYQLEKGDAPYHKSMELLGNLHERFVELSHGDGIITKSSITMLSTQVSQLKTTMDEEIKSQLNIVFFPYKASMWDSLETIYEAAVKDPECVVQVVPIPYYQLTAKDAIPTYEGDLFPPQIPITHYSQYNLENELPDIIYLHNIYDQFNTLTRVYDQYYTTNLRKYTEMLVYVPYHISSFITPNKGQNMLAYSIPAIKNVDKIVLVNDALKKSAIRDGVQASKILVLGSPKFDAIVRSLKSKTVYPEEWADRIKGKMVYLINTGSLHFVNQTFMRVELLTNFFNIPRMIENSVVIWRPHPLTKVSIMKYIPHFMDYYIDLTENCLKRDSRLYPGVILDESVDYIPAIKAADVLISNEGSLLRSYLFTEKKVLYWGYSLPDNSLVPNDAFYYTGDESELWFDLVKKFPKGYDPLALNRIGLASKVYSNTDGNSGKRVHQAIKESVLAKP